MNFYADGVLGVCLNISVIILTLWLAVAFVRYLLGC